jgi:hypothetical protein
LPFLSESPVAIDRAWTVMAIAHDGVVEIIDTKNFQAAQTLDLAYVDGLVKARASQAECSNHLVAPEESRAQHPIQPLASA